MFEEIWHTITQNKLRTALTGFSVAWGIFILIVLLGSGSGLQNGIAYAFRDDAANSIFVSHGETSMAHEGMQPGRKIQFRNGDYDALARQPGVEHITGRFRIAAPLTLRFRDRSDNFEVRCTHPDHQVLENTKITAGRFLNDLDLRDFRKVACIGEAVREDLFGTTPPIGQTLEINGVAFKVVGVFKDEGGLGEMRMAYIPITTAQRTFNGGDKLNQILFTIAETDAGASQAIEDRVRAELAARHRFSPQDTRAVSIWNNLEQFQRVAGTLTGIRLFIWFISIMTILAGMVGVSNIMAITVQERTREIGVRKALGATPWSVVRQVLAESIFITAISGYAGMLLGVLLVEVVGGAIEAPFFRNPTIDIGLVAQATALLVVAGAIAGLIPALRAARIRPIVALRDE